ncbi:MAG TPA: hypothetical protein VMX15_06400 [Candidatus Heimdallarchaeota archaeon]|nr:hypothetical protein [Candidatus Heimdallarchaeota archaeon]
MTRKDYQRIADVFHVLYERDDITTWQIGIVIDAFNRVLLSGNPCFDHESFRAWVLYGNDASAYLASAKRGTP